MHPNIFTSVYHGYRYLPQAFYVHLKVTKCNFSCGSAQDIANRSHSTLSDFLAGSKGAKERHAIPAQILVQIYALA